MEFMTDYYLESKICYSNLFVLSLYYKIETKTMDKFEKILFWLLIIMGGMMSVKMIIFACVSHNIFILIIGLLIAFIIYKLIKKPF